MDFKQFIENIKNKLKNNNFNVIEEKQLAMVASYKFPHLIIQDGKLHQ